MLRFATATNPATGRATLKSKRCLHDNLLLHGDRLRYEDKQHNITAHAYSSTALHINTEEAAGTPSVFVKPQLYAGSGQDYIHTPSQIDTKCSTLTRQQ